MGMPDMSRWNEEDVSKALQALKERDKMLGWDKENNNLAVIGKNGYDEEDWSRDSQGL